MNSPGHPEQPGNPEQWSREELEAWRTTRLRQLLASVIPANPYWSGKLSEAGVDPNSIQSIADLSHLPLTSKQELAADQAAFPPYGRNLTFGLTDYSRLHQTSGTTTGNPLRWLDTAASWDWMLDCWTTIYRLMKLRRDDRLCFPFSFGPFLGFWAGFEGAVRQGNFCLAAGGMSSEARLKLIQENRVTVLGCTPTYALRLAEAAVANGIDIGRGSVRAILVAGEPGGSIPAVRSRIESTWGARVFDHWGMTEIGPLASEAEDDPGNLTVLESECIAEIIDSATGRPVEPGTMGELVITNLGRTGSPVIRYRTGDLVVADTAPHPSGRTWLRLKGGILGRADDMLIVRGNNVFPSSIEAVIREFPEIIEFRIVVSRRREMNHVRLEVEPVPQLADSDADSLGPRLARAIKERLQFQAEVVVVPVGSLPRFEMKASRLVRESS
jgi:phenylacetate-CoA ligase